jgi:hypothetical protein
MIRWPVSFGEAADRLSILQLKRERILDPVKLANVEAELAQATQIFSEQIPQTAELSRQLARLKKINGGLWEIEEKLRLQERNADFGPEFVALARAVYRDNNERFRVKRQIDLLLGSSIVEEKSYSDVGPEEGDVQSVGCALE